MLNKIAVGLLVLAALCYVVGITIGIASVYIVCFWILVASIFFVLIVLVMDLIWKFIPGEFKKASVVDRGRFNAIFLFWAILFYIVGGIVNEVCLPNALGFIKLLGNLMTFVFMVFLGFSLMRKTKVKTIALASCVFFFSIMFLSIISSASIKSEEAINSSSIEKLKSMPYPGWVSVEKNKEKTGVTLYDPNLAFDGFNLYCSQTKPEAYLIDMNGNLVHKWTQKVEGCSFWQDHVEPYKNGDLLVVGREGMLIRLDWNSKVKWKKRIRVHHDAFIDKDERIYVLAKDRGIVFWHGIPVPILNDYVAILSPNGDDQGKIYFYDLIKELISPGEIFRIYSGILKVFKPINAMRIFTGRFNKLRFDLFPSSRSPSVYSDTIDLIHANSIEVIDRDIKGFCKKGDMLFSARHLDLIGIIDTEKEELVWSWGQGEVIWPHHPKLLENGNLLVFDNGPDRGFSRVVELNPLTKKIVWEYKSSPPEDFHSQQRGSNQRFPNGNTLITESDKGHVFEVTKEGRVVWDFYNPDVQKENNKRGTIYRMVRITDHEIYKPTGK